MGKRMLSFGRWKSFKIFLNVERETVAFREKTGCERKDFMQLLIELMHKDGNDKLTLDEIAAQAFVFYFAVKILKIMIKFSDVINQQ